MAGTTLTVALTLFIFKTSYYVLGDDDLDACVELLNPVYADEVCCNNFENIDKLYDEVDECTATKGSSEELTCSEFECLLDKQGLLDDGNIINEKAKAYLDGLAKENPKEKNIIDVVKKECLDGRYEEYVPDLDCRALRFHVCVYTNMMTECESWKDTKVCKQASDLAKKCKEAK